MKKLLTILALLLGVATAHARTAMITDASQLSSNATSDKPLSNLLDGAENDWASTTGTTGGEHHYIEVAFPGGLALNGENEDMVIYIRRSATDPTAAPTSMRILYDNGGQWEILAHAYFLYRGRYTMEYSGRINTAQLRSGVDKLRFVVTANNSKTLSSDGLPVRRMVMSEFQIYKIGRTENYSERLEDRLRLISDYAADYYNHAFQNTLGVLDPLNHHLWDSAPDETNNYEQLTDWPGWENWADGKWNADTEFLQKARITMPDYSWLTPANDKDIATGRRQPTHTIEHELYAIPGDVIALYPFYDMAGTDCYHENFSHWYDYRTGGNLTYTDEHNGKVYQLLDFLIDPSGIFKTKDNGFFGGTALPSNHIAMEIHTEADMIEFARRVNQGKETNTSARLMADLDFAAYGANPFDPIGYNESPYQGFFDGNGHTIRNLTISNDWDASGLFGWACNATIQNFVLDSSCSFTGSNYVGVVGAYPEKNGSLTLSGIINHGNITATGADAGGILGSCRNFNQWSTVSITISDCAFTGTITCPKSSGKINGWVSTWTNLKISNCIIQGSHNGSDPTVSVCSPDTKVDISNCYTSDSNPVIKRVNDDATSTEELTWLERTPSDMNTAQFVEKLGGNWQTGPAGFPAIKSISHYATRYYGTVGTFFYPRSPYEEEGKLISLPDEYVIAADFAQDFSSEANLTANTIIEPIINYRHIFRIKDGVAFAEEFSGTAENNKAYVSRNRRYVTATAGKDFQIRLDSPMPAENTTRSKWYYKIDDTDYRRVCSMKIRVFKDDVMIQDRGMADLLDSNEYPWPGVYFYPSARFWGQGHRTIDGVDYTLCGGGGSYFRMLKCDAANATVGRYKVQFIATDYNGNVIKTADGSGEDLIVQELEIDFLPKTGAVMITDQEYNSKEYEHVTSAYLESHYGKPGDKVDFDEYRLLESTDNVANPSMYLRETNKTYGYKYYKWPVEWENSNYAFGYNRRHDYNMYMVTNNSNTTPYHEQTKKHGLATNYNKGEGLFDRLFYESKGAQRGYYYYVNAASDPGIMARLSLKDFCAGSTIHASAWVSEFSGGEIANLAFNFVALMDNGERVPIHTHVTGYLPGEHLGEWVYVYCSFVPKLTDKPDFDPSRVDHYEIELDNNCKSSDGADYAVDDIRVYFVKPIIYADQPEPLCHKKSSTEVKISAPFDVLLQSLGEIEETSGDGHSIDLYYTFVDKKKYDTAIADGKSTDEAFNEAALLYEHRGEAPARYGKVVFNSVFTKNEEYHSAGVELSQSAFRETAENGDRLIVFNTRPYDETMQTGKEYYVALYTPADALDVPADGPGSAQFLISDECSKVTVLTVKASHVIKVDGEVRNENDIIEACRNQSPVIQVDLYGQREEGGELELIEENAVFDWFDGSMEEFVEIKNDKTDLWTALSTFREHFPKAEDLSDEPIGDYTADMRDIIKEYSSIDPTGQKRPRLVLHRSSYVFPPLNLPDGQTQINAYVLAVPIPVREGNVKICTQPTEVNVVIRKRAPMLAHGIKDIPYPPAISDVPLRISLAQLKSAATATADAAAHNRPLVLPVRKVSPVSDNVDAMRIPGGGSPIYLVQTNDPEYKDLHIEAKAAELWPVGELQTLDADRNTMDTNRIGAVFYSDKIRFKEGYEYRMRFSYEEAVGTGIPEEEICSGQVVFTIKVVPEYQKWTGKGETLNWNNDNNWSRVASAELLRDADDASEHTTDGANAQQFSYAPLDFTKTIINATETTPHLFAATASDVQLWGKSYRWTSDPSENAEAGDATPLVQFDMAERVADGENGVFCRPWYAHTCEQIHFNSGSEIMNQQHLAYDKAWVDLETTVSRWYTLASPLKGVVAGDMYLPSSDARQSTPLFADIRFDKDMNNRFHPAVFQRSWDKGEATVYEIGGSSRPMAVAATWSFAYNDVNEAYPAGEGFSIKTDLSGVGTAGTTALFRLPKADTYYDYYSEDQGTAGTRTEVRSEPSYRLNDVSSSITLRRNTAGKYFLAGNPFMAHIDMAEFLSENAGAIEPKYWILTDDAQGAAVFDPSTGDFEGTIADAGKLAPMQGFFVEAKAETDALTLRFTEDMLAVLPGTTLARSADTEGPAGLMILAETGDDAQSSALVRICADSEPGYEPAEDARLITDNSLAAQARVYTIGGNTALAVNSLPAIARTEIGVEAADTASTTLRFLGVDETLGLMLLDAENGHSEVLYDGMEYRIDGPARGRLFITGEIAAAGNAEISIIGTGKTVTVSTPNIEGSLDVRVYDTMGRLAAAATDCGTLATFTLPQGIYIVEASDSFTTATAKILLR